MKQNSTIPTEALRMLARLYAVEDMSWNDALACVSLRYGVSRMVLDRAYQKNWRRG